MDDLFQGFFERLTGSDYRALRVWQRGASLPIYLSTVVKNYVIDFQRRRRRPGEGRSDTADLEASLDKGPLAPENQETITTAIQLKELRQSGIRAWAKLETRDRRLMCDKLHRDMSNETLASRMQLASGSRRTLGCLCVP